MLKLKNITKDYITVSSKVQALKGVSIEFRKNEFVSILGQSGCGKTTLLNIIGGLDRYTSGDLIINGKSTTQFKDRDWDAYRNYSIGFVFQNYNLISHQSVLSNVELALTISGVSRKERRKRAIKALEDVGLKEQIYKKPNQLSGGQMQRVAIARALVNNPDIILADEPTGALDTKTSVQIMEILKEISKDKLIIMVTHNPELAEKYSSRIIKILDGVITDDSNPYNHEEEPEEKSKKRKTSMKFFTALRLSLNNLMTKKGRTILTSFAGSIGIIGIALILAISTGVQNYITKVEEDTLSSYPITIEESTIDMSSMIEAMMGESDRDTSNYEEGKIYSADIMNQMVETLSNKKQNNNLTELKKYLDEGNNEITNNSNSIQYMYNLNINLYKENTENGVVRVNPSTTMNAVGMGDFFEARSESDMASMMSGGPQMTNDINVWKELLDNEELMKSQYELVKGSWPKKYNEVVLMVNENNEISDYTLYSLGLKDQKELKEKWDKAGKGEKIEETQHSSYTYDDFLNLSFKLILSSDYYSKENGLWIDKSDDENYMKEKIKQAESIRIVGIAKQNKEGLGESTDGFIGYTKELKEYVIDKSNNSDIVKEQNADKETNVFSGLKFPTDEEKEDANVQNLTPEQRMAMATLSSEEISKMMETYTQNKDATYDKNLQKLGAIELSKPSAINIYPKNFEAKDNISKAIEDYNQKQRDNGKEENVINYTDMVGIMMKSVSQIVNIISYVLIAFVAISLIVSSIMIGIITYISVLERTKEIGILRAIGASKKDISRVFNAETFIVGLIAGLLGIGITILLTIPINNIIYKLSDVSVNAMVPPVAGVILVIISMLLTMIAGLIPAKMASKKDPVEALRIE